MNMVSLARWSAAHRRAVVGAWLLVLVCVSVLSQMTGSAYVNTFTAPGTESQRAAELLKNEFPAQSGDLDQIVFRANGGSLKDPQIRSQVTEMLGEIARLPHVSEVMSPYQRGTGAIAPGGKIGFATVGFDEEAQSMPEGAAKRVIATATKITTPQLEVELGGQAIAQTEQVSPGSATAIGLVAAVVVLLLAFGSLWAMALPIVTALFGLGTAVGLIALISNGIHVARAAEGLALMMGLGVGVDYALFIVTRFREAYRANGGDVGSAIEQAMNTAGRAVVFAAFTVVIALLSMITLGIDELRGIAIAIAASVLVILAGTLTLLPAFLAYAGDRIGRSGSRRARSGREEGAFWGRWIGAIQRRPMVAAVGASVVLLALCAPLLGLRLGVSDAGNGDSSQTTRRAYDVLTEGFGPGFNGPLVVVAKLPRSGDASAAEELASAVRRTPGVASVTVPRLNPAGTTATLAAYPASSPQSGQTTDLVERLRKNVIPPVASDSGAIVYVGGPTATQIDLTDQLGSRFWYFVAAVIALAAVLLLVVFRSLLIPLQAAIMNLLSIGAALGIAQLVFQRGWGAGVLGAEAGPIEPLIPVLSFAIVFGLSMDYEVFLISRIQEEWVHSRDAARAIRVGLMRTGRVITAAAAVMVVVFASFIGGGQRLLELVGLALASAILLDAVLIRCVLLPAVLQLAGKTTWAIPGWLDRRLPHLAIEPDDSSFRT